jgi:hypothetical protein
MSDERTIPTPPEDSSKDPELIAYEQLTQGIDPAAIQDPEIRSMLSDRSKDLADIMRGESAEQVVDGRRFVHVLDPQTQEVGWIAWEDYEPNRGRYTRADAGEGGRLKVAEAIVNRTAGDVQEQLATLGGLETFAVSTATGATAGKALEWFGDDLAAARVRASRDANPNAALAGDLNAAISTSIIGGAAVGGLAAGAARAATTLGAQALPSGLLGYGAANLLSRGRQMQNFLATRAAAAGVSPAVSGAALSATRSASTLAAEGALGEMQMAYAQAAIDQRELTSEEIWSSAGTGAFWGLGAYVAGTAMRGAYNVPGWLAKRKLRNDAGKLVNGAEAANAAGKHYHSKSDFSEMIRNRNTPPERGGTFEEYAEWNTGAGGETVPDVVLREMNEPGFSARYAAADGTPARRRAAEYGETVEQMGNVVETEGRVLREAAAAPSTTQADELMEGIEGTSGPAHTKRGKAILKHNGVAGRDVDKAVRWKFAEDTLNRSRESFAQQKARIFAALDDAPAGTALANASKQIKDELEALYPSQPRGKGARAPGESVKQPKKRRGPFDGPQEGSRVAARNVGAAFHAFDQAGEALRKVAGASTAADDVSKQTASTLLDGLRKAQLGRGTEPGAFGTFGEKIRTEVAALQEVEGAQARLYGVAGAEGGAAAGLIGRGGKFDAAKWDELVSTGENGSLQDVADGLDSYRTALGTYAEAAPEAAERIAPALKQLNKAGEKVIPQLKTRGVVDDSYRAQYRKPTPVGEPSGYRVTVKKLYDVAQDVASGDIPTMAAIAIDPTLGAIYGVGKRIAQSETARSFVVGAVTQAKQRFAGAMGRASRAFEYAKLAHKPHLLGAAVTRGTGAPDPNEIDRMTPSAKGETYAKISEAIRGQMQQMDLTIAQLGQATRSATALDPGLGEAMQLQGARALTYLARELPQQGTDPLTGKRQPASAGQVDSFLLTYRAVEDPLVLLDDLGAGRLRTETAEAVQWVYPNLFADMAIGVSEQMQKAKDVPFTTRIQVGLMMGIPGDNLMTGPALLSFQQNYAGAQTPEQAQVMGLNERRAAQAAARMPAASRSSSGRYQTLSDRLESDA